MTSVVGKDPNGRIWFKSDQHLIDITDAHHFRVEPVGVWRKTWHVIATFIRRPAHYQDEANKRGYVPPLTEDKTIGIYTKELNASFALDELLNLKEIKLL